MTEVLAAVKEKDKSTNNAAGKDNNQNKTGKAKEGSSQSAGEASATLNKAEPPTLEKRAAAAAGKQNPNKPSTKQSSTKQKHLPDPLVLDDITVAKSTRKKRSRLAPTLLVLLFIAAFSAGGYYGWQYVQQWMAEGQSGNIALREQLESQASQLQQLQQQLGDQQQQQAETLQQLEAKLAQGRNSEQQQLDELQRRVTSQGSRLRDLSTTTRDDWLLAEAEYLLRLANQRLLTERTTENPVSLLQTADEILKDFDDPDLFAVRSQIATDITTLKISATTDREGLYLQLNSMVGAISQLQLLTKPTGDSNESVVSDNAPLQQDQGLTDKIASNFGNFAEGLKSYLRIRQRDKPLQPLLGIEEEVVVRHNLRVMLEQAQLALLREEPVIYRTSLQNCRQWLQQYFELNNVSTELIAQLDQLSEQTVTRQLPKISGSLQALRNYINLWHLRHEGPAEQPTQQQGAEQ